MFQDILRESWVYQEIGQEFLEQGIEKGFERGLERGLAKGREQALELQRETLMSLVELHFAELIALAKQRAENIEDPKVLQALILKLMGTQKLDEAKKILFEADKQ